MENRKKITAAISAVINYIQDEDAAIYLQSAVASVPAMTAPAKSPVPVTQVPAMPALIPPSPAPTSLWGASGRQSQMQLRNLMQLRAFNRF